MAKNKTKRKEIKKCKTFTLLIVLLTFLSLVLTAFSLQLYLYQIQKEERLGKVEEYDNFILTVVKQKRQVKKLQFQYKNCNYYFDGIEEIYISYGSTKVFLEEAIKEEYINIEDIIINCNLVEEEGNNKTYIHKSNDEKKSYQIKIEEKENLTNIIFTL